MLKNITYISAAKNKKKERSLPAGRISWRISQTAGIILLFLLGVTAGTFFINIFCKGGYEELGTYSTYFIDRFSECTVNKKDLFFCGEKQGNSCFADTGIYDTGKSGL